MTIWHVLIVAACFALVHSTYMIYRWWKDFTTSKWFGI